MPPTPALRPTMPEEYASSDEDTPLLLALEPRIVSLSDEETDDEDAAMLPGSGSGSGSGWSLSSMASNPGQALTPSTSLAIVLCGVVVLVGFAVYVGMKWTDYRVGGV
ncbi:hypothetical protein AJ79_09844 [Helicocarpus griseus UAMH5409]|uniref:Uncharacterized protein n=1 Tax=Helicocarpus griseus UAMH5409 TaxID=1447875 RepID=A0A2B7WGH0_9EURO|nr:hypothetical protein AJ79_09844 [Helicocarpus griseus UAMH5409]